MTTYSIDITYACAQLGVEVGASLDDIKQVMANASAYRFSTRERTEQVQRLVEFFVARSRLGAPEDSFEGIRKAYHRQAMRLHPDRNRGDRRAEDQLKIINAAYAAVESIHREAKDYFRQSEAARREIKKEARETTERERPEGAPAEHAGPQDSSGTAFRQAHDEKAHTTDSSKGHATRYMAASIPRYIRTARLGYLRLDCIIGSWFIAAENDLNNVFDVIMLPEREFIRARLYLGVPDTGSLTLERGRFMPAYVPKDVKTVVVPSGEPDAAAYAKKYFIKEFRLDKAKT